MKPYKLICSFFLATLLLGCSQNEPLDSPPEDPLNGAWSMVNSVIGGFGGTTDRDYEIGDNTWIFDAENGTITIESPDPMNCTLGLCNSTFDYVVIEEEGALKLGRAFYDEEGNLSGSLYIGDITTLTETELVVERTPSVYITRWTFAR